VTINHALTRKSLARFGFILAMTLVGISGGIVLIGFHFFSHAAPTMRVAARAMKAKECPRKLSDDK
jgi:hypothetical protein